MTQLLYAFGIGISFSLGICAGAYLSRLIARIDAEEYKKYNIEMLEILRKNSEYSERLMIAVEGIEIAARANIDYLIKGRG